MTPREIVLAQINHEETHPVPYTFGCDDVALSEQLQQHYGRQFWNTMFVPYIRNVGGIDVLNRESINETHARDIFGTLWRLDQRPWHMETPGLKSPSFEGYSFPTPDQFVNPMLKENAEKAIEAHPESFSIINIGWGLFEQIWGIRGFENAMMDAIVEPDFYSELLDRLTELRLSMVEQCADISADAIMFGDDWGDQRGVILGPERWREFFKPRWSTIYDAVHAQEKIVISHCCGSIASIMPDVIEIGLDVLESVQPEATGMNPYQLKKKYGNKITFWGGLGSQSTIQFATPQEIRDEVQHLTQEMSIGGGYILAPAKSMQPGTPLKNAIAVVDAFTNQDITYSIPIMNSKGADAHHNLGLIYHSQGDLEAAAVEYKKAIEADPKNADAHHNLGLIYHSQGDLDTAISEYQIAIEINPEYAQAHHNLGLIYVSQSALSVAISEFQIAVEIDPECSQPYYGLALTYALENNETLSVESLQMAANLDKNTVMKARMDSGFDIIRESLAFQDLIKFKLQEMNGVGRKSDHHVKCQHN